MTTKYVNAHDELIARLDASGQALAEHVYERRLECFNNFIGPLGCGKNMPLFYCFLVWEGNGTRWTTRRLPNNKCWRLLSWKCTTLTIIIKYYYWTSYWWIEEIRKHPIYQYTEEWAKHSEYQVARWKVLAELDYQVLGTDTLRGAPGFGKTYPPKIEIKPFWFKPICGVDFREFKVWSWLEATKSLGLPISEEADKWYKHISTEDLRDPPGKERPSSQLGGWKLQWTW